VGERGKRERERDFFSYVHDISHKNTCETVREMLGRRVSDMKFRLL
jgi:hypothetical protein